MINTLRGKGGGGRAFLGQPKQPPTPAVADTRANGGVGWQQPLSMPSGFTPTLAGQAKGARVPNLLHWCSQGPGGVQCYSQDRGLQCYIPSRHWTNREIGRRFAAPLEPRPKRRHPHGGEIGARRIDPLQLEEDGLCPIGQGGLCGQEGQTTKANGERGRHARLIKRACGQGDTGVHSPQLLP